MIPLFKPFLPPLNNLSLVFEDTQLAHGQYNDLFEKDLKRVLGTEYVLSVNCYSNVIRIAIHLLGLRAGDEVIASPLCCLSSIEPYLEYGVKIVWADINPKYGTLDPLSVEERITDRTKAVLHFHFCGYTGDSLALMSLCKKYSIKLIDDGLECFGSVFGDTCMGVKTSDIAYYSFSAIRLPNTIDGAALVVSDKDEYDKAIIVRDLGIDRAAFWSSSGNIDRSADVTRIGIAGVMSNVNSYIGHESMKYFDTNLRKQRDNAEKWMSLVPKLIEQASPLPTLGRPNYWVFGILADDKRNAANKLRAMQLQASSVHVDCSSYAICGSSEVFPGVDQFLRHFLAIPCGWWVDVAEVFR